MSNKKYVELASQFATVIATLISAGALVFAAVQFRVAERELHEGKAYDLFIKYNELMREADTPRGRESSTAAAWRHNLAVAIAESIFGLEGDDEAWQHTVAWMLTNEDALVKLTRWDCSTYSDEFVKFATNVVKHPICLP